MRLLVADDERDIARAVKTVLEHGGYTVDVMHDGGDALSYAQSGAYDGVILDIMMPGRDGLSVLRELRRSGVGARAPAEGVGLPDDAGDAVRDALFRRLGGQQLRRGRKAA